MHAASRRLTALTLDNLDDLSRPCRSCVSWELDPVAAQRAQDSGDVALEKEAWLSAVLLGRTTADLVRNVLIIGLMIIFGYLVGFRFQAGVLPALAAGERRVLGNFSLPFGLSVVAVGSR